MFLQRPEAKSSRARVTTVMDGCSVVRKLEPLFAEGIPADFELELVTRTSPDLHIGAAADSAAGARQITLSRIVEDHKGFKAFQPEELAIQTRVLSAAENKECEQLLRTALLDFRATRLSAPPKDYAVCLFVHSASQRVRYLLNVKPGYWCSNNTFASSNDREQCLRFVESLRNAANRWLADTAERIVPVWRQVCEQFDETRAFHVRLHNDRVAERQELLRKLAECALPPGVVNLVVEYFDPRSLFIRNRRA